MSNYQDEEPAAILRSVRGADVALKAVSVKAVLREVLAEVVVEQKYANPSDTNIEAVYTFPLPLGAVLLGMDVEIGVRRLAGQVFEREAAERDYENAVTDGDTAIMLQETAPGLYTMNVGNLMARETCVIRYRYGLALAWQGDALRFRLPTTIAPRYGDPAKAGLQSHEQLSHSLTVEYPLQVQIGVQGKLAEATLSSPTHSIETMRADAGVTVSLAQGATLDRDFVLVAKATTAIESTCLVAADGDHYVALASVRIPQRPVAEHGATCVKIVIDCSGSMAGTSIAQARKATLDILDLLQRTDEFNITFFGSRNEHLFHDMVPATPEYLNIARQRLVQLDANFGGTEIGAALDAVFKLATRSENSAVLLITDGEFWDHEAVIARAIRSGHRVFTVGVGASVAEAFVTTIANQTGGACELVAPQEGMAERIVTQFHRMREARVGQMSVDWGIKPDWTTRVPATIFGGDTVQIYAGFRQRPEQPIRLHTSAANGQPIDVAVTPSQANVAELPRMAARARIRDEHDGAACLNLALDYQLLTKQTNYLVIAIRDDKASELPELHAVPQMLAAGWGGVGSVNAHGTINRGMMAGSHAPAVDALAMFGHMSNESSLPLFSRKRDIEFSPRRQEPEQTNPVVSNPTVLVRNINALTKHFLRSPTLPGSIAELDSLGLDTAISVDLKRLLARGWSERAVLVAFLFALSESMAGTGLMRYVRRAILKTWKTAVAEPKLDAILSVALVNATDANWNWVAQPIVSPCHDGKTFTN